MSEVPASIKAPAEPQVNLLPPEVEARRARGKQRGYAAAAFAALMFAIGYAVFWANSQNASAQAELDDAIEEGARIQAGIDALQYVVDTETELLGVKKALTYVGSTELDFFRVIGDISDALPIGVSLEEISFSPISIFAPDVDSVNPAGHPDIGQVNVNGQMTKYVTAAELEEAFNSVAGLGWTSITTVQRENASGQVYYSFEGTARLTALAFSGRYSASWTQEDLHFRAGQAIGERLSEAELAWQETSEAFGRGEVDQAALDETRTSLERAQGDFDQVLAMALLVGQAEQEVEALTEAVSFDDEGAAASLEAARERLASLEASLGTLAQAILAWDREALDLAIVKARIAAAEAYVESCESRVKNAETAVEADEVGADEALKSAQTWLERAKRGLIVENSYLQEATDSERATRSALDLELAAAALIAPVPDTPQTAAAQSEDGVEES